MISIVNYGMGNIRSIRNALEYIGEASEVVDSPSQIVGASKLILPGVGSFAKAMENIKSLGILDALHEAVIVRKTPILGICLGMQLLADQGTEDGEVDGLGLIAGRVLRFQFDEPLYRIPHTGFNSVCIAKRNSALFASLPEMTDFYFVHSFHFKCDEEEDVSGWTDYYGNFVASVEKGNVYGTQFHPEKSQSNGLIVLRNFARIESEHA